MRAMMDVAANAAVLADKSMIFGLAVTRHREEAVSWRRLVVRIPSTPAHPVRRVRA
jgi:hypothetical protein